MEVALPQFLILQQRRVGSELPPKQFDRDEIDEVFSLDGANPV